MKNTFAKTYALIICMAIPLCSAAGCIAQSVKETERSAVVIVTPAANTSTTINTEPLTDDLAIIASENVLQAAEAYRSIYESVFSGSDMGLALTPEAMEDILNCLDDLGYVVIDYAGDFPMRNAYLVKLFFDNMAGSHNAELSIYEICTDAGILCHTLHFTGDLCSVTRTRLAWLEDGPFALQGTIPTITYSDTYAVTDITFSDGLLYYAYDMPDNPPGTNHDGHIDTEVTLFVSK